MTIIKGKTYFKVISEKTGRNLGIYKFKTHQGMLKQHSAALKRLRQIEFFKHKGYK